MVNFKRSGSCIVGLFTVVVLTPPAWSADYLDFLKGYIGTRGPGQQQSQTQALIKSNINTRQAQLETEVQSGVRSGQLTSQEEQDLRAELNRIAAAEGSFLADGSLDNWEVQTLLDDLSGFSRRLDAYLTNPTVAAAAGTNTTYSRGWYDTCRKKGQSDDVVSNQQQLQANVDTRLAQLDSAIERGINTGYINWTQARHLESELEHILDDEEHFTEDGRLSYREANQLIADLDALDAEVKALQVAYDRNRRARYGQRGQRNRNVALNANLQQSVLRQRIQAGLRSGQLTKIEADRLFRSEDRIAELEAQMRESGGRLGYNEQRRLLAELDDLSHHITSELNDHHVQF